MTEKDSPFGRFDIFQTRPKLQYTDFSDCSLLAGLTQLKYLTLPARKKLIRTEALNALTCEIRTDDPFPADSSTSPYRILPAREAPPSLPPGFAVRLLEYGETAYTNDEITQPVVDKMAELIRAGEIHSLLLSPNETGDWDLFTMDIAGGWAAPVLHFTWDQTQRPILCQPINEKYAGSDEAALVQIDGQTPVSKNFSLEDLDLAAKCAVYFARTGKLYPAIPWAGFS